MKLAFVGDVHGRVLHALAAVSHAQHRLGERFDHVFQVGDFGAFPRRELLPWIGVDADEPSAAEFLAVRERPAPDPWLTRVRALLENPIVFARGNHDDAHWLRSLDVVDGLAPADPHDLFRYAPDGTVLDLGTVTVGVFGGVEQPDPDSTPRPGGELLDEAAFALLWDLDGGAVDVLITHQPAAGICPYSGGSGRIAELVARLRPALHVGGHVHAPFGPLKLGPTTYLGLSSVLRSPARDPERAVQPASLAVLDTATMRTTVLDAPWFREIHSGTLGRWLP